MVVAFATLRRLRTCRMEEAVSEQCQERVWHEYDYYKCTRKGIVFEDEQWRCKQHSKAATEARQAKSEQRYAEESAQRKAGWDAEAEQKRRAECFPALLAALEELLDSIQRNDGDVKLSIATLWRSTKEHIDGNTHCRRSARLRAYPKTVK